MVINFGLMIRFEIHGTANLQLIVLKQFDEN